VQKQNLLPAGNIPADNICFSFLISVFYIHIYFYVMLTPYKISDKLILLHNEIALNGETIFCKKGFLLFLMPI